MWLLKEVFARDTYLSLDFGAKSVDLFRLLPEGESAKEASMALMLGEIEKGNVPRSIVYEKPEVADLNPLKYELELFRDAILRDERPIVSGEDGRRALAVAEEILRTIDRSIL